ncbi:MAG: hypothetical protein IPP71_00315 [Bacteroidetes bacterium]|nr:hypothetical protein [Bacteroidota bacterium]
MNYSTSNGTAFSGVQVYVDDIYIPRTGSITGDNLVKDGSVELSKKISALNATGFRILLLNPQVIAETHLFPLIRLKKIRNQSLYLEIPFEVKGCTFYKFNQ